jgi:SH3-like domain-containing protein
MATDTDRIEWIRPNRRAVVSMALTAGILVLAALLPGLGTAQAGPMSPSLPPVRQIASPVASPTPANDGWVMTPAQTASDNVWRIADTGGVQARVRSAPSLEATVIMRLDPGTVVEPLNETASADGYQWRRISVGGSTGWIVMPLLLEPAPPPRIPIYVVAAVGERGLNVRESPSTLAPILGSLKEGEVVERLDGPREGDGRLWLQVRTDAVTGWVIAEAIGER